MMPVINLRCVNWTTGCFAACLWVIDWFWSEVIPRWSEVIPGWYTLPKQASIAIGINCSVSNGINCHKMEPIAIIRLYTHIYQPSHCIVYMHQACLWRCHFSFGLKSDWHLQQLHNYQVYIAYITGYLFSICQMSWKYCLIFRMKSCVAFALLIFGIIVSVLILTVVYSGQAGNVINWLGYYMYQRRNDQLMAAISIPCALCLAFEEGCWKNTIVNCALQVHLAEHSMDSVLLVYTNFHQAAPKSSFAAAAPPSGNFRSHVNDLWGGK